MEAMPSCVCGEMSSFQRRFPFSLAVLQRRPPPSKEWGPDPPPPPLRDVKKKKNHIWDERSWNLAGRASCLKNGG